MASSNRHLLQAACLLVLVLVYATVYAEARTYCDDEFHMAVYEACQGRKRSGGPAPQLLNLRDYLAMNRLRGTYKRSVGSPLADEAYLVSGLQKRSDYDGIASLCCYHGCTSDDIAVVC
uniref:Relaxin-like gonad-stimulating peptide n=1 Tax=Astropecten scoparius TaxID=563633 RepID=A0A140KFG5_9ECHI|nr:relaxin-like gonad-stimulating peptide precursor [Astropecten scoparius]